MYTGEEYKVKIEEIEPIALALVASFRSKDARIIASKMVSEDSYILGMCIGTLLQVDNKKIFARIGPVPEEITKKIDELSADTRCPSLEETKEETKKLEPLALKMIMDMHPKDAREFASGLDSIDAYILGQHIGGLLESGYHKTGQDERKVKMF